MKIRLTIVAPSLFPVEVNTQDFSTPIFQIDKPALPISSSKKALPLLYDGARMDCLNKSDTRYTSLKNNKTAILYQKILCENILR
jgi:hypothetical protein